MPNRSQKITRYKMGKNKRFVFAKRMKIILPLLLVLVGVLFYISFRISLRYFPGDSKLTLVENAQNDQDLKIITFNPIEAKVDVIYIPASTQVNAARNLGTWRLGSVWKLDNKRGGGEILAHTVTKNFGFPIETWSDTANENRTFSASDIGNLIWLSFSSYDTNLTWADKINLSLFLLRVNKSDISSTDLRKTNQLEKKILIDGEEGYEINNSNFYNKFRVMFLDQNLMGKNVKISSRNFRNSTYTSRVVSSVIEIMGGKIVSITNMDEKISESCLVLSKDPKSAEKINNIFNCTISDTKITGGLDMEIRLGDSFLTKF